MSARYSPCVTERTNMEQALPILSEKELTRVQDILIEQLHVKREHLTRDAKFKEDLGADSLDMVEITMSLEEEFGMSAPDQAMEQVESVEDLYIALAEMLKR